MRFGLTGFLFFAAGVCSFGQNSAGPSGSTFIIAGEVRDHINHEPLAYATIGVVGRVDQTISASDGKFGLTLPVDAQNDTLIVTYVGFATFKRKIAELEQPLYIFLEETAMILPEFTVANRKMDLRGIDRDIRILRGNLYVMYAEVTNKEYNYFLFDLEDRHETDLYNKCTFDLSGYPRSTRDFYMRYHRFSTKKRTKRSEWRDSTMGFNDYPAINISYESAVEYCKWLTIQYNENPKKKKFKKVLFRLPTLKEWQIAALGYDKFQSWNLLENKVETLIPRDTSRLEMLAGDRHIIPVTDRVLYPWYKAYYYRYRAINSKNCYLGNFYITKPVHCPANNPAYDGFALAGQVAMYFPNNIGLYDVCGNVAEMIDEKGRACGGSWKDIPEHSTIRSTKAYSGPEESVGFRVFMEVIEK
jgi:formylglycine-generating enzyme required for sulfatase activity